MELVLDILRAAGFSAEDALSAMQVLLAFVVGHTVAAYAPRRTDEISRPAFGLLGEAEFPRVLEAARLLPAHDVEEEFDLGLDVMLAGLEKCLESRRRAKVR